MRKTTLVLSLLLVAAVASYAQGSRIHWSAWPGKFTVSRVCFSPNSQYVAAVGPSDSAKVWDVATGNLVRTLPDVGGYDYATGLSFSADNKQLTVINNGLVRTWDIATGQLSGQYAPQTFGQSLATMPDQPYVPVSSLIVGKPPLNVNTYDLRLLRVSSGEIARSIRLYSQSSFNAVACSPNGAVVATVFGDGNVQVFNTATVIDSVTSFRAHTRPFYAITVSPNGAVIATGGNDRVVKLWNANTGELIRRMVGHTQAINALSFTRDGRYLVSGSQDGTVMVWETNTGAAFTTYDEYPVAQSAVAVSPNHRYVASGTADDGALIIWNSNLPVPTGVNDRALAAATIGLRGQPNPFLAQTTIQFTAPQPGPVTVKAYNTLGVEVGTLFEGEAERGEYTAVWNASQLPAGIYYCRVEGEDWSSVQTLVKAQ